MVFGVGKISRLIRFVNFISTAVLLQQAGCQHQRTEPEPASCEDMSGAGLVSCDRPIGQWKLLGLEEETITVIAAHPANPEIIYAGSQFNFSAGVQGKLFKSKDCGNTWDTLLVGGTYRAILFDPTNPEIVYAVPGSIIKSTDCGSTWNAVTNGIRLDGEMRVQSLAIDPRNPNVLYAGVGGFGSGTLYKSSDAGMSWKDLEAGYTDFFDGVVSLAIDPENTSVVYAGTDWRGRLLKTTNGGNTWEETGLGETGQVIDIVTVNPINSKEVFAAVRFQGLFVSNDAGETWTKVSLPDSARSISDIAFGPENPPTIVLASYGFYVKKDIDSGWLEMTNGMSHKNVMAVEITHDGNTLYAGLRTVWDRNGGIYVCGLR